MSLYLNILAKALCALALLQTVGESAPAAQPSAAPTITVRQIPRARVAFLPHQGAYWSVGPVISKVRNALSGRHPAPGVFVRYESDPRLVSPLQLEARVGFALEIGQVAPDGFQTDTQPSQQVASMTADDSLSLLARHYTTLQAWAMEHDYQSVGPIIERYPSGQTGSHGVEIQLVVRRATDAVAVPEKPVGFVQPVNKPLAKPHESPTSVGSYPKTTVGQRRDSDDGPDANSSLGVADESDANGDSRATDGPGASTGSSKNTGKQGARTARKAISQGTLIPAPAQPSVDSESTHDRAVSLPPSNPTPAASPSTEIAINEPPVQRSTSTDYTELAIRLIPPAEDWTPYELATIGPKVMRVRAIAHLAQTRFGSDASPISGLSDALTKRFTHVWGARLATAIKPPPRNKNKRRHRAVDGSLQQLDHIFSDMLTDRLDAKGVEKAILEVLAGLPTPAQTAIDPAHRQ